MSSRCLRHLLTSPVEHVVVALNALLFESSIILLYVVIHPCARVTVQQGFTKLVMNCQFLRGVEDFAEIGMIWFASWICAFTGLLLRQSWAA